MEEIQWIDRRWKWSGWIAISLSLALSPEATSHDVFAGLVRHQVSLYLKADHADLTIDLKFFEDGSSSERRRMDANNDGHIDTDEVQAYTTAIADEVADQVDLLLDDTELCLIPLYAPRIDLLGYDGVGKAHHRLTLFYFAPLANNPSEGSVFEIRDRLWPAHQALTSVEVHSDGKLLLNTVPQSGFSDHHPHTGDRRQIRIVVEEATRNDSSPTPQPTQPLPHKSS